MLSELLKFHFYLLFLSISISTYAKEKEINFIIKQSINTDIKNVKIYGFYGHDYFLIDSISLNFPESSFNLKSPSLYSGFYRIAFTKELFYDFISYPGDSLTIHYNPADFKKGLITLNKDNELLLQFKKEIYEISNSIMLIQNIQTSDTFIQNSSQRSIMELKFRKNELISEYQKKFKSTVFSNLADFLREPIDENGQESGKLFLEYLHLSDSSSIRTNFISQKLIDYLAFYKNPDEESFKEGIKEVFNACQSNEFTRQYCLFFYLQLFYRVGPEPVFRHLVEDYYLQESCHETPGEMNSEVFSGVNRLIHLLPGNKIDQLNFTNLNGKKIDNYDFSKKNKQTLYLFWSPECGYCEELFEKLKKHKKQLRKNNIQVISFAITQDRKSWEKKSNNFKWENTSDLQGWQSEIIKTLAINKTPMLILTDSKNTILKYDFYFEELIK